MTALDRPRVRVLAPPRSPYRRSLVAIEIAPIGMGRSSRRDEELIYKTRARRER